MKLKFKYTKQFVSSFLFFAGLIVIASIVLLLIQRKVFVRKHTYKALFADAVGLSSNTPVYLKGFKVGYINNFELNKNNLVEAEFEVYDEFYDKIVKNSALYKSVNPITSSSTIELLQGTDYSVHLEVGSIIYSIDVPQGEKLLAEHKVVKSGDVVSTILYNLELLTTNLNKDDNADKGAVFRAVVNIADASENLKNLTSNLDMLVQSVDKNTNKQGVLFKSFDNISQITENLNKTTILLNTVLKNADTFFVAYNKPEGLAMKMIDPEGDKIVKPIQQSLDVLIQLLPHIKSFVEYLSAQKVDIGLALTELKSVLREMQITFESINNSPLFYGGKKDVIKLNYQGNQTRLKDF